MESANPVLVQYLLNMLDREKEEDWTSAQAFRGAIRFLEDKPLLRNVLLVFLHPELREITLGSHQHNTAEHKTGAGSQGLEGNTTDFHTGTSFPPSALPQNPDHSKNCCKYNRIWRPSTG